MYSVVEIEDGIYGEEYDRTDKLDDAEMSASLAYIEEGLETEILKLVSLRDVYGVETDAKAWIPVHALPEGLR